MIQKMLKYIQRKRDENMKELIDAGFLAVFSILPYPVTLEQAMQKDFTLCNIANTTEQVMRIIKN